MQAEHRKRLAVSSQYSKCTAQATLCHLIYGAAQEHEVSSIVSSIAGKVKELALMLATMC